MSQSTRENAKPDPFGTALPTLDTERLRLRHPRPEDVDALLAVFSDERTMRYWGGEPIEDLDDARRYRQGIDDGFAARHLFQWAITEQGADRLIGTVTLYRWDRVNRRAEIGFILAPDHWGRGIASEAVGAVLAFGFAEMDLHRVEADVDPDNERSRRLVERFGFRDEGMLRERWFLRGRWADSVIYGLLRRDFRHVAPGGDS